MARQAVALAPHLTLQELEARMWGAKNAELRDKYRALLWIAQGVSRTEVAQRLGVCRETLRQWVRRYKAEGEAGLGRKPGQGRRRVLTPQRVEQLQQQVRAEGGVWTLKRMQAVLHQREGVEITLPALWYRLREAGWSWKSGRPQVPNQDPVAQAAFKKKAFGQQWRKAGG